MRKLSFYTYKKYQRIKLICDVKQILQEMFNINRVEKDKFSFDIIKDIPNKKIIIEFKENENRKI